MAENESSERGVAALIEVKVFVRVTLAFSGTGGGCIALRAALLAMLCKGVARLERRLLGAFGWCWSYRLAAPRLRYSRRILDGSAVLNFQSKDCGYVAGLDHVAVDLEHQGANINPISSSQHSWNIPLQLASHRTVEFESLDGSTDDILDRVEVPCRTIIHTVL